MIPREVFLDHLWERGAISLSEDESIVYADKAFFAYRVAVWAFDNLKSGKLSDEDLGRYWGILSQYLEGNLDLKFSGDVLYYVEPEGEQEEVEGC